MTTFLKALREWLLWNGAIPFSQAHRIVEYEHYLRLKAKFDPEPKPPLAARCLMADYIVELRLSEQGVPLLYCKHR